MIFGEIVVNSKCTSHERKHKFGILYLDYWLERWWLPEGLAVRAEGSPPCEYVCWKVPGEQPQHPASPAQMA